MERSHEENRERAYVAASRRTDRCIEVRVHSALKASEIHKKRTGKGLRITKEIVQNDEMYEEEDDDLPRSYRLLGLNVETSSADRGARPEARFSNKAKVSQKLTKMNDEWRENHVNRLFAQYFPNAIPAFQKIAQIVPTAAAYQQPSEGYSPAPSTTCSSAGRIATRAALSPALASNNHQAGRASNKRKSRAPASSMGQRCRNSGKSAPRLISTSTPGRSTAQTTSSTDGTLSAWSPSDPISLSEPTFTAELPLQIRTDLIEAGVDNVVAHTPNSLKIQEHQGWLIMCDPTDILKSTQNETINTQSMIDPPGYRKDETMVDSLVLPCIPDDWEGFAVDTLWATN